MSGWEIWGRVTVMGLGVFLFVWPVFTAPAEGSRGFAAFGRWSASMCGFALCVWGLY